MKFFPTQINNVVAMVQQVMKHNRQSEDVLRTNILEHREWGKRDRKFMSDLFYALLRHRRFYFSLLEKLQVKEPSDFLLAGIHLALHQAYSGVHSLWPHFSAEQVQICATDTDWSPDVRHSIPAWLYQRYANISSWTAMNNPGALYIRINTLKTTSEELVKELLNEQIAYTQLAPDCIRIDQKIQLTKHTLYKVGKIEIQDISSQRIAPFLEVSPGMKVLDACAGAGGKSIHLAALMKNIGSIIATDVHVHKLHQLQIRADRAGVTQIQISLLNDAFVEKYKQAFHRILIDVPCSGTGTLRRKPEIKWKLTEQRLDEVICIQRNILRQVVSMLKPSGKLVYSTCSILLEENEHQVDWLLHEFPQLDLDVQQRLDPTEGGDGFFMARIKFKT